MFKEIDQENEIAERIMNDFARRTGLLPNVGNPVFDDLHKAFESRVRLGIMSALAVNDSLDFTSLKEFLDVTDGNLATHIKKLEKEEFIGVEILCRQ